jgi:predicted nuclease of predicted toxin-antitoxin system
VARRRRRSSSSTRNSPLRDLPLIPYAAHALKGADLGAENYGVKPFDFPLLTDENVAPDVVTGLRERKCNVRTVGEEQLIGRPVTEVLARAVSQGRIVVTHDLAFGRAAVQAGPFVGIIYLRPGHISATFVLDLIDGLRRSAIDVSSPFVLVAERRDDAVRVRVRPAPPW